jgi:hypothetical protein
MIHKDRKSKVKCGRVADFLELPARLRASSRADELALVSGGWREEVARIRRRDSGCGRALFGHFFAFLWLLFLVGCVLLLAGVWASLLDWKTNNRYLANSCVVLDKRLAIGTHEVVMGG